MYFCDYIYTTNKMVIKTQTLHCAVIQPLNSCYYDGAMNIYTIQLQIANSYAQAKKQANDENVR